MAFDSYFVRLSFGLKVCRAARANGVYADSTTKTNGLKQFLKLCFCAGERRGAQNTHGSGKKTHQQMLENSVLIGTFGAFFSFPPTQPQKSPQNDLPEPLRDPPRDPPGG